MASVCDLATKFRSVSTKICRGIRNALNYWTGYFRVLLVIPEKKRLFLKLNYDLSKILIHFLNKNGQHIFRRTSE